MVGIAPGRCGLMYVKYGKMLCDLCKPYVHYNYFTTCLCYCNLKISKRCLGLQEDGVGVKDPRVV